MTSHKPPAKVLLVDDHPLVREGLALRISLHPDLAVCGEAASVNEALAAVARTKPDLAIIDLSLQNSHGLDLVKHIKSRFPAVKMLVLSGFQESLYGERCLRAGALGYLNKQESNDNLIAAMRTVLTGQRFVGPELSERLINEGLEGVDASKTPIDRLTNREFEIFQMIGNGLGTGTIAERLFLSRHTIDTHRENIKRKLGLKNAAELTRAAVQWVLAQIN